MNGDQILKQVIDGNLFSVQCCENKDHPCIVIWSSGAAEQLEAIFNTTDKE